MGKLLENCAKFKILFGLKISIDYISPFLHNPEV